MNSLHHYDPLPTDNKDEEENDLVEFTANDISLPDDSKSWEDFIIGNGGFASVFEVRVKVKDTVNIVTKKAAFKSIKYDSLANNEEQRNSALVQLKREANIVNRMSHPNIIELIGICYENDFFGLILELCEGRSLGNVCRSIQKQNTIALRVLANWAYQISSAMQYLNDQSYIHRDLKAENVLVRETVCFCNNSETTSLDWCDLCGKRPLNKLWLKITDFGLSKTVMSVGHSVVGTWVWLAPEVLQQKPGQSNWTEFSDVWSFGVVLWELLAREMPHAGVYPIVVAHWNQEGQTLKLKDSWPQKWKEIMEQCWDLEPQKRPTFLDLVEYFEEYTNGLVEVHVTDLRRDIVDSFEGREIESKSDTNHSSSSNKTQHVEKKFPDKLCVTIVISLFLLAVLSALLIFYFITLHSKCSNGYEFFEATGFCYKTFLHPVKHNIASEECREGGGNLASIHSSQENKFILNQYKKIAQGGSMSDIWIGLEFDSWESRWLWIDGAPVTFINWKDFHTFNGRTLAVLQTKNGKWSEANANRTAAYTCKKPNNEELSNNDDKICSIGYTWLKSTGYCYKVGFNPVSFEEAVRMCTDQNAHLMSIHSAEENAAIVEFYRKKLVEKFGERKYIARSYLWTGLTFDNGSWSWVDGTSFDFSFWKSGRPTPQNGDKFWSAIGLESVEPSEAYPDHWIDVGSPNFFSFICQKLDISKIEKTVHVVLPEKRLLESPKVNETHNNCSTGYTYFEKTGYCYKSGSSKLAFLEANGKCIEDGANLVSIHSHEENRFIIALMKKTMQTSRIYTGLFYAEDKWKHTDESPVDYTNWIEGEPNFIYSQLEWLENRVTIVLSDEWKDRNKNFDEWNNVQGDGKYGYVCKH